MWQKEVQELQSQVVEENTSKLRLQMELDSKDSEIEQLQTKLATLGSETASLSSADNDNDELYSQGKLVNLLFELYMLVRLCYYLLKNKHHINVYYN